MKYNPDEYEPVEDRIKRFYGDHKDGRIITILRSDSNNIDYAVFEAQVFVADILRATGWAQERRDLELSTSKYGKEYESVNFSAWLENAETSAIGRALANFNYQGSKKKRASLEEIEKVQRATSKKEQQQTKEEKPPIDKTPKHNKEWYVKQIMTGIQKMYDKEYATQEIVDNWMARLDAIGATDDLEKIRDLLNEFLIEYKNLEGKHMVQKTFDIPEGEKIPY